MTLLAAHTADEVDEGELVVGERIRASSRLAGPLARSPRDGEVHRVAYRGVNVVHGRWRAWRTMLISTFAFAFEVIVVVWVLQPSHLPPVEEGGAFAYYANAFVVFSIIVMEGLRIVNVLFIALASVIARDPIPVPPAPGGRIAFLTTIVPSKEPVDVVRGTLQAALRIEYDGILDVWILDEGDDPAVKAMCRELGVNHFTRAGVEKYNQPKGAFKAKTKHGNYNAWVAEHGDSYEIFLSVDPDHVPLSNYAERILGYFRDPDVAFVSGPQCYANDETFVTRAAESQQFLFHSLIQRAANRFNAAMLVGTNNAVRISALQSIGGLQDSITEDMATGLKFHTRRNPKSKRRWKSVYTPDVLAVGEGPSSWGDFFSQQMRWSRGTLEVLLTQFWKRLPRLSPGRMLHYCLLTSFYPAMALGWLFGAVNACLFLTLGVQGIVVPVQLWLALYVDAAVIQLWLYVRNRRYNVSPYEVEGSSGLKGMMMSTVASPIYAASLIATLLRLPARFVVTPKGLSASADVLLTFRRHIQWGLLLVAAVVAAVFLGHAHPAVLMWPVVMLLTCAIPPLIWLVERIVGRRPAITAQPVTANGGSGVTTETLQRAAIDALLAAGSATRRSTRSAPAALVSAAPDVTGSPLVPATGRPRVDADGSSSRTVAVPAVGELPRGWVRNPAPTSRGGEVDSETGRPSPVPRPERHPDRRTPSPAARTAAAGTSSGRPLPGPSGSHEQGLPRPTPDPRAQSEPRPQVTPGPRPVPRPAASPTPPPSEKLSNPASQSPEGRRGRGPRPTTTPPSPVPRPPSTRPESSSPRPGRSRASVTSVSGGSRGANEAASASDARVDDQHTSEAVSVNASTVAMRIVALAAVAAPGRTAAGGRPRRPAEGEGTEAS